ncbi:PREDICTED: mannan synthase 1-like isoform X2 [Ipomoea nil]|uniref:mannan synthase 1-like isoform X2 n=1 Tax=Ipomoea nil TaxID=35883 RepID=UPI0009008727|nr:PREDICTED: mannan synthase 1-like isoform X2 [Ipomoea nil]
MSNIVFQEPRIREHISLESLGEGIRLNILTNAIHLCTAMSIMLFIERVYMAIVITCAKCFEKKRYMKHKSDAMKEDLEQNRNYPMVLVQIPMYNEKEVYKLSIGAVCGLSWPADRLIVQVLDDSTNRSIRELVVNECEKWKGKGVNVKYETRNNRNGYKADFLLRTIPYLLENPELGLVQAKWKFVNADECMMTRLQEMSLDYHFSVEQEVGSSTCSFFGFNGSAGVWRIQALNDAGGWKDRTTVEDMDLAIRANLRGWKFLYVGDLEVQNELPSTFKAYRIQQQRWSCGPANLFRKMLKEILLSEHASLYKKFQVIYAFFVRKIIAHWVTLYFYCIVIPIIVVHPEIDLVKPLALYLPATVTILNAACTWRSIHLILPWILFENAMSLHRANAALIGLLEGSGVNEWVVTEKLGYALRQRPSLRAPWTQEWQFIIRRIHLHEFLMGLYLMHTAVHDLMYGNNHFYGFLFMQAAAFFTVGVSNVGTFIPN